MPVRGSHVDASDARIAVAACKGGLHGWLEVHPGSVAGSPSGPARTWSTPPTRGIGCVGQRSAIGTADGRKDNDRIR